jgi:hypothetical protein
MTTDLNGRVVMVTGGASGIGEACVDRYAQSGARIVVVDQNGDEAARTAERIVAGGGAALSFAADVSDALQCEDAVAFTVCEMGALDIAANIAGVAGTFLPIHELSPETWRRVLSINLDGIFYCMRAEIGHMIEHDGGVIVNMGSMYSVVGRERGADYVASKHGVHGLTRSATLDYAEHDIRVNTVGPAIIRTPMYERNQNTVGAKKRIDATPALRPGEPAEVANMVVWLSSDEASYVYGGFFPVDGGYTAR